MTTEEWVRQLNALARELDEAAASMHPSAWSELLGQDMARWEKLAKMKPEDSPVQLELGI